MKSSFLESLSAALSKRTNKGFTARKTSDWPRMQANRRHRFRLGLEPLEDRLVLSNLLVTSSVDLLNTAGTLRDAVNQANLDGAQGIIYDTSTSTDLGTGSLNGSGQASISTSALAIGTTAVTAHYAGDAKYTASTSTPLNQFVVGGRATHITVTAPRSVDAGSTFEITISAFDAKNNPALFGSITPSITFSPSQKLQWGSIVVNYPTTSETLQVTLDKAGPFTMKVKLGTLPAKTCPITVNIGPTVSFVVTSSLSTVQVGLPVKISVQALDAGGNKTNYSGTALLWTNSPCPIGDSNNGAWGGTASIKVVGGSGSQYVLLELAGQVNVTAAVGSTITGVTQTPINVTPDWYSKNIFDPTIGELAREDFYSSSPNSISCADMPGLFAQAETEELSTNSNGVLGSLAALANNYNNPMVNMPFYVRYLTRQVLNYSSDDVDFLARYYYNSTLVWTVSVTEPSYGGGFDLTVNGQTTGILLSDASAGQVQSALQKLPNVGNMVTVFPGQGAGNYDIMFTDPYIMSLSGDGSILNGGSKLIISAGPRGDPDRMAIPVSWGDGKPVFGYSGAPAGVALAAQTTALVNQWFLGTVEPNDAVSAGANGGNGISPSPYVTPSGTANAGIPAFKPSSFNLYGPARVPLVTDVQQGGLGDCWLMAALADVACIDPARSRECSTTTATVRIRSACIPHK